MHTYGLSWSADVRVARGFALAGIHRTKWAVTVLLETYAPPDAIICAPAKLNNHNDEREFAVDRRRLCAVTVIERFGQLSYDQLRKL